MISMGLLGSAFLLMILGVIHLISAYAATHDHVYYSRLMVTVGVALGTSAIFAAFFVGSLAWRFA